MRKTVHILALFCLIFAFPAFCLADAAKPVDTIPTDKGDLTVTSIGHGSLMFQWQGKVVHVDPWGRQGDYSAMPKADLVLVTHEHDDHLDNFAIKAVRKEGTVVAAAKKAAGRIDDAVTLKNGESKELAGIMVDAVPAYNLQHRRPGGEPFHPQGVGNGYVLHFGNVRVYVAGDTEFIPEMAALKGVDVAFLPVNLPYTMTLDMLVEAATAIQPKVLFPYHTTDTNMERVQKRLAEMPGIDVRIRPMK